MPASLEALLLALDSIGVRPHRYFLTGSQAMEPIVSRRRMQMTRFNKRSAIVKKRWSILEGSRRPLSLLEKRVRTLQSLLPGGQSVGLFSEAADYISSLEMKVKLMKLMVEVLSCSSIQETPLPTISCV